MDLQFIFIIFGFIGTLVLAIPTLINLYKNIKYKNTDTINIIYQICFIIGNILWIIYGLGLSIVGDFFLRSSPTWLFNSIMLFVNVWLLYIKIKNN